MDDFIDFGKHELVDFVGDSVQDTKTIFMKRGIPQWIRDALASHGLTPYDSFGVQAKMEWRSSAYARSGYGISRWHKDGSLRGDLWVCVWSDVNPTEFARPVDPIDVTIADAEWVPGTWQTPLKGHFVAAQNKAWVHRTPPGFSMDRNFIRVYAIPTANSHSQPPPTELTYDLPVEPPRIVVGGDGLYRITNTNP